MIIIRHNIDIIILILPKIIIKYVFLNKNSDYCMKIRDDIINSKKLIIFDSDGVLVEEGKVLDGAIDLIDFLTNNKIENIVFSNNSTKHPLTMKKIYNEQGLQINNVINSGMLSVDYCKKKNISRVYVVGEKGLVDLFEENNIKVVDKDVDAVIVGMDRMLTYEKLAIATRLIRNGARYIATNPDPAFPTKRGLEPGAGSMIAALNTSTDKQPEIIVGKPNTFGFQLIFEDYKLKADDCLMIGDRYETDIIGANEMDIEAIIVNTGIAKTREKPGNYKNYKEVPVIDNLRDLILK